MAGINNSEIPAEFRLGLNRKAIKSLPLLQVNFICHPLICVATQAKAT